MIFKGYHCEKKEQGLRVGPGEKTVQRDTESVAERLIEFCPLLLRCGLWSGKAEIFSGGV
ncbi:MAG: hypothetical protein D3922_05360 [Candidatus Electrothrix sp. AR1]|nr:hypothetical protein [Candidatus Electrothrix sp. AR1]